jgi:uracil-DNA glycosylase
MENTYLIDQTYPIHASWSPLFDKYKNITTSTLTSTPNDTPITNIFPPPELVFRVFSMNVKDIKIVLLGQDPYHNPEQAHGLSFSVPSHIPIPPSLKNIYKEIKSEYPDRNYNFTHGNLEKWFNTEKIFLLNASLTVIQNKPGSHIKLWEKFTNDVIKFISENNENAIFLLLGNFAKAKEIYITNKANIILGTHPSPLSASNGFFGSNIFKKVESILGREIDWSN